MTSSRRSRAVMGTLSVLSSISSWVGGGTFCRARAHKRKGKKRSAAVTEGMQNSLTPHCSITKRPTDLTTPLDTTKLEQGTTPRMSAYFRPNIYEHTNHQITPWR